MKLVKISKIGMNLFKNAKISWNWLNFDWNRRKFRFRVAYVQYVCVRRLRKLLPRNFGRGMRVAVGTVCTRHRRTFLGSSFGLASNALRTTRDTERALRTRGIKSYAAHALTVPVRNSNLVRSSWAYLRLEGLQKCHTVKMHHLQQLKHLRNHNFHCVPVRDIRSTAIQINHKYLLP